MTSPENPQSLNALINAVKVETRYFPKTNLAVEAEELKESDRNEVLAFLTERPIHTVGMTGMIRDNGLVSEHNRGTFYGCRNSEGRLEGVALIGHATLVEARTDRALQEFALLAQTCRRTHMIMGEVERMEEFWKHYADEGQDMRRACRELLFELRMPITMREEIEGLRLATLDDLEMILPVHAQMAEAESGVNPLEVDPEGFRARCARRIEMGRVFVLVEHGRLIFKADIQSDTPDVVYLEGIYVSPSTRNAGLGRRCLSQLCRKLRARTKSVCLLVNEENGAAQAFYRMCNFKLRSVYDTIFLRRASETTTNSVQ